MKYQTFLSHMDDGFRIQWMLGDKKFVLEPMSSDPDLKAIWKVSCKSDSCLLDWIQGSAEECRSYLEAHGCISIKDQAIYAKHYHIDITLRSFRIRMRCGCEIDFHDEYGSYYLEPAYKEEKYLVYQFLEDQNVELLCCADEMGILRYSFSTGRSLWNHFSDFIIDFM